MSRKSCSWLTQPPTLVPCKSWEWGSMRAWRVVLGDSQVPSMAGNGSLSEGRTQTEATASVGSST